MKSLLTFILIICASSISAQTWWHSIPRVVLGGTNGYEQFIIDPFTDNIWVVQGSKVAVIEPDGTIEVFTATSGEISGLWEWNEMRFAFTPGHTYFANENLGLYTFDNYSEQLVYNLTNTNEFLKNISTNGDTVYMAFDPVPFSFSYPYLSYTPSSTIPTEQVCDLVLARGDEKYMVIGTSTLKYTLGDSLLAPSYYLIGSAPFNPDPDYIGGEMYDWKYKNLSDTLFVSSANGISLIMDYDVLPLNYTPNNTTNMPSAKVLEIEFDESDSLWAVFGDDNKDPIAIAKLDGTNWTSIFTQSNSPINFDWFVSIEFDSAGNLWVSDEDGLHTLAAPTNPTWLSTIENERIEFSVAPNPSSGSFTLSTPLSSTADQIGVVDMMGRTLVKMPYATDLHLNLQKGVYLLQLIEGDAILGSERIVIK